jgi:hypothetical protein
MHKSRLGALVVDCQSGDLSEHAEFWGSALGSEPESQEGQINQRYVRLNGASSELQVLLQKVDHQSRVHFDIETDDIEAEVNRLLSIGAKIVERMEKWVIMEAPSKHRFCVIDPIRPDFEEKANVWSSQKSS